VVDVDLLSIFELARGDRMRGHVFKLAVSRCHSEMKIRFLIVRCIKVWTALPARVGSCGSLGALKSALESELGERSVVVTCLVVNEIGES
jgi:hypothetical protein